ncbi:MAG: hypothetical protein ACYCVY_11275 [Acidiferrobacteraceae bacterium]
MKTIVSAAVPFANSTLHYGFSHWWLVLALYVFGFALIGFWVTLQKAWRVAWHVVGRVEHSMRTRVARRKEEAG